MASYRIAICDDDPILRERNFMLCREILTEHEITYAITEFSSAEELEEKLEAEEDYFDLLLLDIEMKELSGMDLARRLRARRNRISIIFVSGYEEYLPVGYEVQPIHFLIKPVERRQLEEALMADWEMNHRQQTVVLQKGSRILSLSLPETLYIETGESHNVRIIRKDGEIQFPASLTYLTEVLPDNWFARCHNSYLVNLEHVREVEKRELYLDDGSVIPIGRKYYKEFQSALIGYLNH